MPPVVFCACLVDFMDRLGCHPGHRHWPFEPWIGSGSEIGFWPRFAAGSGFEIGSRFWPEFGSESEIESAAGTAAGTGFECGPEFAPDFVTASRCPSHHRYRCRPGRRQHHHRIRHQLHRRIHHQLHHRIHRHCRHRRTCCRTTAAGIKHRRSPMSRILCFKVT